MNTGGEVVGGLLIACSSVFGHNLLGVVLGVNGSVFGHNLIRGGAGTAHGVCVDVGVCVVEGANVSARGLSLDLKYSMRASSLLMMCRLRVGLLKNGWVVVVLFLVTDSCVLRGCE